MHTITHSHSAGGASLCSATVRPSRKTGAIAGALLLIAVQPPVHALDYFPLTITTSVSALSPEVAAYHLPNADNVGYNASANEYGAVVTLDPNAPFVLRSVVLPYYSDYTLDSGLIYRIYDNDGPLQNGIPTPGTLLDERRERIVTAGGGSITTLSISYNFSTANELPPSLTVTVQFTGLGATQHAGWVLTSVEPTTGSRPYYFWERVGQKWVARTFAPLPPTRPTVTVARAAGNQVKVTVGGSGTGTFILQRSKDFTTWTNVRTNDNAGFEYTEASGTAGPAFFRAFAR